MNAENVGTVDVLKKRFESFQTTKKPVHGLDDRRHEKNVNKRNIKRTPAFRRDINISRKLVNHSPQGLAVTNNLKPFSNRNSNNSECNKISLIDSPSYKADNSNQKLCLDRFIIDDRNKSVADKKALIQCLKKKLETNNVIGCKPKVPKKNSEHTLKTPLPVGPPPKKPPRTFAHDKQVDPKFTFQCIMESHKNFKSDPKIMLQKLEQFVTENSHTYGTKDDKSAEKNSTSKKSSKKLNLFNLAKSLKCLENQNIYNDSLEIYPTDEQNYLTTKSYNESGTEHIYDEPIFLKPYSRLNTNAVVNCHEFIGNEWVYDSDKSNLHYMVSYE